MPTTEKLQNAEYGAGEGIPLPNATAALPSLPLPIDRRKERLATSSPRLPSERHFGFALTGALAFLGIYGIFRHRSWKACAAFLVASVIFGFLTLAIPRALAPLNKAWFHLGKLMGKIVSPIVLGIIFLGIITPVSLVTRLFGRDELRLKRRAVNSYWIDRPPNDSDAESFKNQF